MHLKVMFPNKESSQNSPLQNDTVTKHLMLCMHNISAHIISVCNRGGRQSSNNEKKKGNQGKQSWYIAVYLLTSKGSNGTPHVILLQEA
jgi:hypothetical protein